MAGGRVVKYQKFAGLSPTIAIGDLLGIDSVLP